MGLEFFGEYWVGFINRGVISFDGGEVLECFWGRVWV